MSFIQEVDTSVRERIEFGKGTCKERERGNGCRFMLGLR